MIVACVRQGPRYGTEYVYRLKSGVERYLKRPHRFICLTDRPLEIPDVETVNIGCHDLTGWWAKMALFRVAGQFQERIIYFDLDTVVCGNLNPLADLDVPFGICANFTQLAGCTTWPCKYGSCVMTFSPGYGWPVWKEFNARRSHYMDTAGMYGDQKAIEMIVPDAALLQHHLPRGFFLGYRDIKAKKPDGCSLVIFAGRSKPHNCETEWIVNEWKS